MSKFSIGLLVALALSLPATQSRAQSGVLKSIIEDISDSVEKVKEVDDLANRKNALRKVLDFSISRTENFYNRLKNLEGLEPGFVDLRESLLSSLEKFLAYYENALAALEEAREAAVVKQIGVEIKNWRNEIFNPGIEKVIDFLLVFQGEEFLELANNRFERISGDLNRLKDIKLLKKFRLQGLLGSSSADLKQAKELISEAKEILLSASDEEPENSIQDLVELTLVKIKSAYKKFLEINAQLKELLQ
ncbi:MAG: hypothetical protein AAB646_02160 [Patescibacteria group bacterium]